MGAALNRPLDILTVADTCVDLLIAGNARPQFGQVEQKVDRYSLTVGGSATIFAMQFAKLGGRIGLLGTVGNDAFGSYLRDAFAREGIDLEGLREDVTPTGISVGLVEQGDRAILTWPGTIHGFRPEDFDPAIVGRARHWHLASYFLMEPIQPHWPSWLAQIRRAGLTVSLDTNWAVNGDWQAAREILSLVDVLMPNEQEALRLSDTESLNEAGVSLARQCGLVVIKRGSEGSSCYRKDQPPLHVPPQYTPPQVVDSVGAGDCFDAGFLRAWLRGQPLEECLQLGNRCGAQSLEAAGGVDSQYRAP